MNERDRQRQHILTALAEEWERHPNLRFGQLVENAIQSGFAGCSTEAQHYAHCIYNVTDEEALARLLERHAA